MPASLACLGGDHHICMRRSCSCYCGHPGRVSVAERDERLERPNIGTYCGVDAHEKCRRTGCRCLCHSGRAAVSLTVPAPVVAVRTRSPRPRAQRAPSPPREPVKAIDVDVARRLYEDEGLTLKQVAAQLGVSHNTLRARLDAAGIRIRAKRERWLPDAEIARRYRAGETLEALGRAFQTNATTIAAHLRRMKIPIVSTPRRAQFDLEAATRDYVGGAGLESVARAHKVGATTLSHRLRAAGVTIRPASRPSGAPRRPAGCPWSPA